MTITRVDILIYDEEIRRKRGLNENALADVAITLDHDFAIHNIQLLTGEKGPYILFPKDKVGKGIAYPINNETREMILNTVLDAYENKGDRSSGK